MTTISLGANLACTLTSSDASVAWFEMGGRALERGALPDAVSCFSNALHSGLVAPAVYNNLGNAYWMSGKLDEAIGAYSMALQRDPKSPAILTHLGVAFMDARMVAAAAACFDLAIVLAPHYPSAHWNRGLLSLLTGNYELGWADYEWRWKLPRVQARTPKKLPPRWDGEALSGEKVLVCAEQGLGDTLQFVRFVPEIIKRGGRPILICQPELKSILSTDSSFGIVACAHDPVPRADYFAPLLSLPAILRVGGRVTTTQPYLTAEPDKVVHWRSRFSNLRGLKIGLVWAGAARGDDVLASSIDRRRSMSLAQIAPLVRVPGCSFVSLQKGPPQQEIPDSNVPIIDLGPELNDFSDTAAVVANLDLVISVDTSVVHLCGALGRPIWMLSRFDGCWRWLLDRPDSPWYPTLRIYSQHRPQDWDVAIRAVVSDLQDLVGNR